MKQFSFTSAMIVRAAAISASLLQDYNWLNADFNDPIFAVHIFQQTFRGAFIGYKRQLLALCERDERQHHAGVQRGDQHFFGGPGCSLN